MERKFTVDWPYGHVTRDGRKARIICSNRVGEDYNLVVLLPGGGCEYAEIYHKTGKYRGHYNSDNDLFNAPEPDVDLGWINIYAREANVERRAKSGKKTKLHADDTRTFDRTSCYHLVLRDGKVVDITDDTP